MRHPKINHWVSFYRTRDGRFLIKDDLQEHTFTVSESLWHFARKLDGRTDPYALENGPPQEDVENMIQALDNHDLLHNSRILSSSFGSLYFTLIRFPRHPSLLARYLARAINFALLLFWLPTLLSGVLLYLNKDLAFKFTDKWWLGIVLGVLLGMILHESAHGAAALAYSGRVYEMGVSFQHFIPGAYTLMDHCRIKKRLHRVQVMAAGVESNYWLAGLFLILCCRFPLHHTMFFMIAVQNLLLGTLNLLFINGVDGGRILCELLGDPNSIEKAIQVTTSRGELCSLWKEGASGRAKAAVCFILSAGQISWPLLLLLNTVEVIKLCLF